VYPHQDVLFALDLSHYESQVFFIIAGIGVQVQVKFAPWGGDAGAYLSFDFEIFHVLSSRFYLPIMACQKMVEPISSEIVDHTGLPSLNLTLPPVHEKQHDQQDFNQFSEVSQRAAWPGFVAYRHPCQNGNRSEGDHYPPDEVTVVSGEGYVQEQAGQQDQITDPVQDE
jgi:hypothetical protein